MTEEELARIRSYYERVLCEEIPENGLSIAKEIARAAVLARRIEPWKLALVMDEVRV